MTGIRNAHVQKFNTIMSLTLCCKVHKTINLSALCPWIILIWWLIAFSDLSRIFIVILPIIMIASTVTRRITIVKIIVSIVAGHPNGISLPNSKRMPYTNVLPTAAIARTMFMTLLFMIKP